MPKKKLAKQSSDYSSRRAFLLILSVMLGIAVNTITMGITGAGFLGARSVLSNGGWLVYWVIMQTIVTVLMLFVYYYYFYITPEHYMQEYERDSNPGTNWTVRAYNMMQRTDYWKTRILLWIFSGANLIVGGLMFGFLLYSGSFWDFYIIGDVDVLVGPAGKYGTMDDRQLSFFLTVFVLSFLETYLFSKFGFLTRAMFVKEI